MEISNDIIFRSPENGDYILLDCSTSNVTKNGLYQKLPDGRTALKVKINGLDALYVLPIASADTLGGIRVGSGLSIDPTTGILSATGGGTGTVISVSSGNLTPLFTVSIANPTTTPSFTFTQVAQAANLVFASPNGSSGVPTFRALVASDIPSLNYVASVGATAPLTSSGGLTPTLSTSMSTNKLIGRYNSGTGVMEEISLGSGLSLSGGVLTSTNQGGGSSVNYYLNGGTSQGSFSGSTYYQMGKTAVIGTGVDFSISADGYIANFITDANDPSLLNIPAGSWNISAYFSASSSGGTPSFYCELYKYDGSTLTLIASSSSTPESISSGTSIDLYVTSLAVPSTTLSITDRLAIRIYVSHSGRTITLHTQDSHLCQIATTFSSGITALNGLTAQVQTFATGTSGTDFGISSSSSTHTFNLPIASATNTGKLSNTDWSFFNNKQTAYTILTTLGTLSNAVGVLVNNGSGVLSYNNTYIANPMTTLGDVIYGGVSGAATRLAGETGSQKKFLTSQGSGGNPTAPQWSYITAVDIAGIFLYQNLSAAGSTTSYTPNTIGYRETVVTITGLTGTLTINAPTAGALVNGDKLIFRLSDNGTLRTLNFVATTGGYIQKGAAVPISTISINKLSTITFMYNSSSNTWDCVGYVIEY